MPAYRFLKLPLGALLILLSGFANAANIRNCTVGAVIGPWEDPQALTNASAQCAGGACTLFSEMTSFLGSCVGGITPEGSHMAAPFERGEHVNGDFVTEYTVQFYQPTGVAPLQKDCDERFVTGATFQEARENAQEACGPGCTSRGSSSSTYGTVLGIAGCSVQANQAYTRTVSHQPRHGDSILKVYFYDTQCPPDQIPSGVNGCREDTVENPARDVTPQQCNDVNGTNATTRPILIGNGTKYKEQTDYRGPGIMPLQIRRYYNSQDQRWTFYYQTHIEVIDSFSVALKNADGSESLFLDNGDSTYSTYADDRLRLSINTDGSWLLMDRSDTSHTFNASGQLTSMTNRAGQSVTLSYTGGLLETVAHFTGRTLTFTHDAEGQVESIADPAGNLFRYEYSDLISGRIDSVIYPDSTPGDVSDNPTKNYHYEAPLRPRLLTGITDENGDRYATYAYDLNDPSLPAISSELGDGVGRHVVTKNDDGSVTVTNALGKDTIYTFEVRNGLKRVATIEGQVTPLCGAMTTALSYGADGFVNSRVDNNGNIDTFGYNERGLRETVVESVGSAEERTTVTTWHPDFRVPSQIVRPGQTEDFTYDTSGRVLTRTLTDTQTQTVPYATAGNTRVWTYTYTSLGLIETVDGPRTDVNDVTTYGYDTNGELETITNALGHVTRITERDARGYVTKTEDPNGIVTEAEYDERGRMVASTLAAGTTSAATTLFQYDDANQLERVTEPSGAYLTYTYDEAHRLTRVTDRLGHYVDYELDAAGNRTTEQNFTSTNIIRRTQTRLFDELSRLREYTGGMGQLTSYEYDDNDNLIDVTDPLDRISSSQFDALDRLIASVDPDSFQVGYAYDARDNTTSVTDQRGLVTTTVFSGFNDVLQIDSPDTGVTTFRVDEAGNRTEQTTARNIVTKYHYDALNRLIHTEYPGAPGLDVEYEYDTGANRVGRLFRMRDNIGVSIFSYNKRGERVRERKRIAGLWYDLRYTYDRGGNLTSTTYPSGKQVKYLLNGNRQVKEIQLIEDGVMTVLATGISYRPFGPMQRLTYGNGLINIVGWDQDYRQIRNAVAPIQDLRFAYNATDNLIGVNDITDRSRDQDFGYDNLNRLTSAEGIYGELSYAYDAVGNRTTFVENGVSTLYQYGATSNRLEALIDGSGLERDYRYNLTGSTVDTGEMSHGYNRYERVARSTIEEQDTLYRYNGEGERVLRTAPDGTVVLFHFDASGNMLAESSDDGVTLREFVFLDGVPLATLDTGEMYYHHLDQVGASQKLTKDSQELVWSGDYRPFGMVSESTSPEANPIRFPGQYEQAGGSLYYNYYRVYDPALGRYTQSDPIGLSGGLNTYGYAMQNPNRHIDPNGLVTWSCKANAGGVSIGPVGIQETRYECTSECSDQGTQVVANVVALAGGVSAGPRAGFSSSTDNTVLDSNDTPDPSVFHGPYREVSAAYVVGAGPSGSLVTFGGAAGLNGGVAGGAFDAGIFGGWGRAWLTGDRTQTCDCEGN